MAVGLSAPARRAAGMSAYAAVLVLCMSEEDAFTNTVETITGPITKIISTQGIRAVYEALDSEERARRLAQEVEALVMLISAQFDISGSMSTHMPIPIWKKCVNNL
mgnify:CR=1 FL=1